VLPLFFLHFYELFLCFKLWQDKHRQKAQNIRIPTCDSFGFLVVPHSTSSYNLHFASPADIQFIFNKRKIERKTTTTIMNMIKAVKQSTPTIAQIRIPLNNSVASYVDVALHLSTKKYFTHRNKFQKQHANQRTQYTLTPREHTTTRKYTLHYCDNSLQCTRAYTLLYSIAHMKNNGVKNWNVNIQLSYN
jgi:hypothetical protein